MASGSLRDKARAARGDVGAVLELARTLGADADASSEVLRVAVLSTFTAAPLAPYLIVEGAARDLRVIPAFAPFNQLELQAFNERSELFSGQPEVIVIAALLEDLSESLCYRFAALRQEEVAAEIDAVTVRARELVEGLRSRTSAAIFILNFAVIDGSAGGLAAPVLDPSQASAVAELNAKLAYAVRGVSDCHVVDFAGFVARRGADRIRDRRMWLRARLPFGSEGLAGIGALVARYIAALLRPARKCLVVDLDNTLWGGVLGEDGFGGIRMGHDHPGTIFRSFQQHLVGLRDRGVLLAVSSKNDRDDAIRALAEHPDCLLRPDLFSAVEIGWGDKATSIRNIARDLSIGLDAVAFFDDSAVEREWVRTQLPEALVIDVPADPLAYIEALENSEAFDSLQISPEDQKRASMYRDETKRKRLREELPSSDAFLRDLEIKVRIGTIGGDTLPRVTQLIGKTNQFNTTTRRYSQAEIEGLLARGGIGLWIRVSDRFGDSGLVGVAIAVPTSNPGDWLLDVLLLSCRVIGRGAESVLLHETARLARRSGGRRLMGEFIHTPRNEPARTVYRDHGFASMDDSGALWVYDLAEDGPQRPDHIELTLEYDPDD